MTTTTTLSLPLNQLIHSPANVRRFDRKARMDELAASIAAHGLRQNLNVVPTTGGRYAVVAGARRLHALRLLARQGTLPKDAPIPCMVLAEGDDPAEISLVENTQREPMHPDDQCAAFLDLIETKGMGIADVAARFGLSPHVVRQRLKLAHVSPRLRALYRKGEMTLEHMMALAISDDHAAQEEAWSNLPDWNRDPGLLKEALTHAHVAATDKLARLVGLDAYKAAGGSILRDLFDAEDDGYLTDRDLVQRLASARMAEAVSAVQAEGWKWVIPEVTRDYDTRYARVYPQADAASGSLDYAPEDLARAGARVILGHDGSLRVERGLIHPDDQKAEAKAPSPAPRDATALPATLVADLTAHRSAALRIELARNPGVALACVVHTLAHALLYAPTGLPVSSLAMRAASPTLRLHMQSPDEGTALAAMDAELAHWGERLPDNPADLFQWCLDQPQHLLLTLLACLAALSVDAVQTKQDRPGNDRLAHADQLAVALGLDMSQWWMPTAEGFYSRLPKAALALAVAEAGAETAVPLASVKKAEAARRAAKALAGTGWLPQPLRTGQPGDATGAAEAA